MTLGRRQIIAALTTSLAGVIAGCIGVVRVGSDGALSAFVGTALVLVFLSAGSLPLLIAGDGKDGRAKLGFMVLGMTYVLRLVLAVGILGVAEQSGGVDSQLMGVTVICCAIVWTATQVVLGSLRRHQPTLDA